MLFLPLPFLVLCKVILFIRKVLLLFQIVSILDHFDERSLGLAPGLAPWSPPALVHSPPNVASANFKTEEATSEGRYMTRYSTSRCMTIHMNIHMNILIWTPPHEVHHICNCLEMSVFFVTSSRWICAKMCGVLPQMSQFGCRKPTMDSPYIA